MSLAPFSLSLIRPCLQDRLPPNAEDLVALLQEGAFEAHGSKLVAVVNFTSTRQVFNKQDVNKKRKKMILSKLTAKRLSFVRTSRSMPHACRCSASSGPLWQTRARARVCHLGAGAALRRSGCTLLWRSQSRGGAGAGSDVEYDEVVAGSLERNFEFKPSNTFSSLVTPSGHEPITVERLTAPTGSSADEFRIGHRAPRTAELQSERPRRVVTVDIPVPILLYRIWSLSILRTYKELMFLLCRFWHPYRIKKLCFLYFVVNGLG